MPDNHFVTSAQPAPESFDASRGERRSVPTGLPIVSTERLTFAERDALHELRRRFALAAETIADCIEAGRVDRAIDGLQHVAGDTDGLALASAARLGSGR